MVEEQLAGSWDQPTRTVVMHNAQPGRLQTLTSELSDRASALVDLNERALQLRTGGPREEDDGSGQYGDPGQRVRAAKPCQSGRYRGLSYTGVRATAPSSSVSPVRGCVAKPYDLGLYIGP